MDSEILKATDENDWEMWDRQFEADVADGKLDALAAEALAEFDCGETTEL
jgi:hypothetical protein